MAASMSRRSGSLFLLFCVVNLQILNQSNAQDKGSSIQEVDPQLLDSITQTSEHVLVFFPLKVLSIHDEAKAKELGIEEMPNLVFFHNGSPNIYPGEHIQVEDVIEWIEGPPDELIQVLEDDTFEHLTQAGSGATTGDWLVVFYKSTCSSVLPTLRAVANRLKGRAIVARVDMTYNPKLVKRFKITNCPTLKFFRLGNMYDFNLPKSDVPTLVKFAEGWYKNSRTNKVPPEQTPL